MGSTHLVEAIRGAGVRCVEKPMVNTYWTNEWPAAVRILHNKPTVESIHDLTTREICDRFLDVQERLSDHPARFHFEPSMSIADNFARYFEFLLAADTACVLRATSLNGLLNKRGFRGVVFLLRDPLQAYLSYIKAERHLEYIDALGGPEAEAALQFWAWTWNAVGREYLDAIARGLDPLLVRYESIQQDVERSGSSFLTRVFASFVARTNATTLSASAQARLAELVEPIYSAVSCAKGR
jgi:hypothetical protein